MDVMVERDHTKEKLEQSLTLLQEAVDYCYSSEAYEKGKTFLAVHKVYKPI